VLRHYFGLEYSQQVSRIHWQEEVWMQSAALSVIEAAKKRR
jgi:hypothetical protein